MERNGVERDGFRARVSGGMRELDDCPGYGNYSAASIDVYTKEL
jgi:hypothetical protein